MSSGNGEGPGHHHDDAEAQIEGYVDRSFSPTLSTTQAPRSKRDATCSPGSHAHSDRPNWEPAETIDDYLRNCAEGLEDYSDRRAAKLLGISRAMLWRAKLISEIPDDLFDLLVEKSERCPSPKALAAVAMALRSGKTTAAADTCPHCGHVLRVRQSVSPEVVKIVNGWLTGANATVEKRGSAS